MNAVPAVSERCVWWCGVGLPNRKRWDSPAATWMAGCVESGRSGSEGARSRTQFLLRLNRSIGQSDGLQSNMTQKLSLACRIKEKWMRFDGHRMNGSSIVCIPYMVSARLFYYGLHRSFAVLSGTIRLSANHCGSCGTISDFARSLTRQRWPSMSASD